MTKNSDFKRLVRERMAKTGESYTAARRHLEVNPKPAGTLEGWFVTGPGDGDPEFELNDYEGGLDPDVTHNGKPCAFVRSVVDDPQKHAVVMQSISAKNYSGKRIRFSGWVRTDDPETSGRLWVRVVPYDRNLTLNRAGYWAGAEWSRGEVVLDVEETAESIMFGIALYAQGAVWMSGANFEVVDKTVPVTQEQPIEPTVPRNLEFTG